MIQDIAYELYLKFCKEKGYRIGTKQYFLFDTTLYVHKYHELAKKEYRKQKLKYLLND